MRLPLSWLRDWIEVDASATKIAEALTLRGFYVEGIESRGHHYPGVVVARVLEVRRHPNAERLSLCRVDSGRGEVSVVCGAPNVKVGMLAALATEGARLPGDVVIQRTKIRGEESQGMLCSGRELDLSEDHQGILDLERLIGPVGLALGQPLDDVLDPPDEVLLVEVPFNRPDGLGVLGLAREVRAALAGRWSEAGRARLAARWSGRSDFDLELEDSEGCPRYIAQIVEGVKVEPSQRWLVRRLEAMGQRPVNNIVDLTNFILHELGQPLHAFDLKKLGSRSIRVRRARAGETLTTLDGRPRELNPEVLVIADRARPVALAGIMGGAESEVDDNTTSILLECAWFDPKRVRRGAASLGLVTEASRRYERGVDPEIGSTAVARFLSLLREVSPGRLGAARERSHMPSHVRTLRLRTSRCARLLGVNPTAEEAARYLLALEFGVERGDPVTVRVPSWRPDITLEDDLVEEVGRSHGYDRIPEALPDSRGEGALRGARERTIEQARRAMLARGLTEAWTTSLVSESEAARTAALLGDPDPRLVRLANPVSREGEVLRPNLIAGLLRACAHNLRQGVSAVRLFEVGATFRLAEPESPGTLPEERLMLAALVTGPRYAHAHDALQQPADFEDAKGLWEAWLEEMSVDTPEWRPYSSPGWKTGASAEVATTTSRIGWAGTLGQELLRSWEIEVPVHLLAVGLDPFMKAPTATVRTQLPGRYPPARRDVAFFVPESVTHGTLEKALRDAAGEWLTGIELFDVYTGPGTPPGMKSLAFALRFEHPDRTLAEAEIQAVQERLAARIASDFDGRLRER
jgi:phenylalanyl-tRNA synthetase beta chain